MWEPEPYVLNLSDVIRLSDDDLLKICAANPDLRIEQNAAGQLEIMRPAGALSSARHVEVTGALGNWNETSKAGIVFELKLVLDVTDQHELEVIRSVRHVSILQSDLRS